MLQRYKLRLRDGTVLAVDHDGLNTWLNDERAMVQVNARQWCTLKEFLAEERAAALRAPQPKSKPRDVVPLLPPKLREDPPPVQVLAEDTTDPGPARTSTADDELPTIRLKPLAEDEARRPPADVWGGPTEPPSLGGSPNLLAFADDPRDPRGQATIQAGPETCDEDPADFVHEAPPRGVLDERLIRAIGAFGGFLSFLLHRLDRGHRWAQSRGIARRARWRPADTPWSAPREPYSPAGAPRGVQVLADNPMEPPSVHSRRRAMEDEMVSRTPLKRVDDEDGPLRAALHTAEKVVRSLGRTAAAWAQDITRRVEELVARRNRPGPSEPSDPWNEPQASRGADPAPRMPLKAPTSIGALPALRFAETHEPEPEEEDVYEGETEGGGIVSTAWSWTKRIVLLGGLVAVGVYAAIHRDAWLPQALQLGQTAFTQVGTFLQSRDQKERQQRALQGATEQLPYLSPETIRLVLSGNPTGALEPPEVFALTRDAAERGRSALTPAEAQEMESLQQALIDGLSPGERERFREYERVRARRVPFSFEDGQALELFARGARALPAERRERLQALFGKAVAAGLGRPAAAPRGPA